MKLYCVLLLIFFTEGNARSLSNDNSHSGELCKGDDDKYYPKYQPIPELEPDAYCYGYFDENCTRRGRCEQGPATNRGEQALTTNPKMVQETCEYNGNQHPKEEKLWYMEYDPSCYMYFEENCNSFSRCELGRGIFYCKYNGRFQKVGETFQEQGDKNCWHQFDHRCVMSGRCARPSTTPEPVPETCEYNGRPYPKEEKLWYTEYDPSCYMYFEQNCNRFSRCELAGGVLYCKYQGRFQKIRETFQEVGDDNCWSQFDDKCTKSRRCDRVPATTTSPTTLEPVKETCEYNGRKYPKDEKLWYMEYDHSCYWLFDSNCFRISRCELGNSVFYCKYQGRYYKVGEMFDDPHDSYTWHKFDSKCRMTSRAW